MRRGAAAAGVAVVLAAASACGGSSSAKPTSHSYTSPPASLPVTQVRLTTSPPPWPAPALENGGQDSAAYVTAAGLPYRQEMLKVHYHAHLDVVVDGHAVTVPAGLGFVVAGDKVKGLAPLHTHTPDGIIHIENDVPATFVLGQVFVEWGVRFTPSCLGPYCTGHGKELGVFVDGKRVTGDPRRVVLRKHEEIAVEFGRAGALPSPPASYTFPSGL